MRKLFALLFITVFAVASVGCENKDESSTKEETTTSESTDQKAEADESEESESADNGDEAAEETKTGMVEVPADGKEFDPPVEKSRVPGGVWICDMGTVEWAAKEKPEDGKCPICGMQLTKHEHAGDSPK